MSDIYDVSTYLKHKRPGGWGSICPEHLDQGAAQALLNGSVLIGEARYAVDEGWALKAYQHQPGRWHGFPIPWSALPVDAVHALIDRGLLDERTWRKALRQGWGSEYNL
jgi:hypothetical protein